MQLSNEEQQAIREWLQSGKTLADIQALLVETFQRSLTYMEIRFLVDDLNLELKKQSADQETPSSPAEAEDLLVMGKVTVTVDKVVPPGAMISGEVTFSDGESALWTIDALGQPRLDPKAAGYQPQQQDLMDFQEELNKVLQQQGF